MNQQGHYAVHGLLISVDSNTAATGDPVWGTSPGECKKLENQQVALKETSLFSLWVKGHRFCGVQDFCHLPTTVHDFREASNVELGQ